MICSRENNARGVMLFDLGWEISRQLQGHDKNLKRVRIDLRAFWEKFFFFRRLSLTLFTFCPPPLFFSGTRPKFRVGRHNEAFTPPPYVDKPKITGVHSIIFPMY